MKKLLCVIAAMTMVVAIQAEGEEKSSEPGELGVGYQGIFYGGGNSRMDAASIRWKGSPVGVQGLIGQLNTDTGVEQNTLILAAKGLVNLIERENSTFYVGPKIGMAWIDFTESDGTKKVDSTQLIFGAFVGTEYFFQGLPEIGFNFEVGYDFAVGEDNTGKDDNANAYGINVTLGANYYF
jgi:hypothetical protein